MTEVPTVMEKGFSKEVIPLCCAVILMLRLSVPSSNANFLVDGSFEKGTGWTTYRSDAKGVHYERSTLARSGKFSAHIAVSDDAARDWYQWQQRIAAVTTGATYFLRGWVRTEGVHGGKGAYLSLSAYDGSGKRLIFSDSPSVNGSHDWTCVSCVLEVPSQSVALVAHATLHGYGKAWFDDFELMRVHDMGDEEVLARWKVMTRNRRWLLLCKRFILPDEPGVPLTPKMPWSPGKPFGWLNPAPLEWHSDDNELLLRVPLSGDANAILHIDIPAGNYTLHLWLNGAETRIPLRLKIRSGERWRTLSERVFPIRAQVFSWRVSVSNSGLDIGFDAATKPLPVGGDAPSVAIRAIAITHDDKNPLTPFVAEHNKLLDACVNRIWTILPDVQAPAIIPIDASQISPDEIARLRPKRSLVLTASRGEVTGAGALVILHPNAKWRWHISGEIPSQWLQCFTGVPGWCRLAGMQRWDFWLSPARWFERKTAGVATDEGMGIAWVRIAIPKDAPERIFHASLYVNTAGAKLSLPIAVRILPVTLPEIDADIGMFYNATIPPPSCPDDELPRRWEEHFADMKAHGMNCVFVYTFRLVHSMKIGGEWQWCDEALRRFLAAYARLFRRTLYICTHGDRFHPQGYDAYVRHVRELARQAGVPVAFMPVDEAYATEERLRDAEHWIKLAKAAEGTVALTTDHAEAVRFDRWFDVRVYGADFLNRDVMEHTKASGDTLAVYNGGSAAGPEPAKDRFFYGVYAYVTGVRGIFQWAYQWGNGDPLDDRDGDTRDWCYTFPVGEHGCAPTPQWEAIREGVNDWRYLLLLERIAHGKSQLAKLAQELLKDVQGDVNAFLEHNTRMNYGDLESAFSYQRLTSLFPARRLLAIRTRAADILAHASQ